MNQLGLDRSCPRLWYLVSCILIDAALAGEVYHRSWALGAIVVLLMIYMTARRFTDAGWSRWWAIPYAAFTLSPYAVLFFVPHLNARLVALGNILLQLPAIVWPKKENAVPLAAAQ